MTTTVETPTRPPVADAARALLLYEPQSASAARRLVRTALRGWGLEDRGPTVTRGPGPGGADP